jgi:hypothetical protein
MKEHQASWSNLYRKLLKYTLIYSSHIFIKVDSLLESLTQWDSFLQTT